MSKGSRAFVPVSVATIRKAEDHIWVCQSCESSTADTPFSWILDYITGRPLGTTEYAMSEPAYCPNCQEPVFEDTLVKWG